MAAFFWSLKPQEADLGFRAAGACAAWKDSRRRAVAGSARPYLAQIENFDQLARARYGHHTLTDRPVGAALAIVGRCCPIRPVRSLGKGEHWPARRPRALRMALAIHPDRQKRWQACIASGYCGGTHMRCSRALFFAFTCASIIGLARCWPFIRDRVVASPREFRPGHNCGVDVRAHNGWTSRRLALKEADCLEGKPTFPM